MRSIMNLGLKEVSIKILTLFKAKEAVEKAPIILSKDLKKADAEEL